MFKRGVPYLRKATWLASAVWHDSTLHAYYEKMVAEGIKYMCIIGHVTWKIAAVTFAVLPDDKRCPALPAAS